MQWSFNHVSGPAGGSKWSNAADGFASAAGSHNKTFGIGWTGDVAARVTSAESLSAGASIPVQAGDQVRGSRLG